MSYLESILYMYIKSKILSGFRKFLDKKVIIFSLISLLTMFFSTFYVAYNELGKENVLLFEGVLSLSLFLTGIITLTTFNKKIKLLIWIIILVLLLFLSSLNERFYITSVEILFLIWIFLVSLFTFLIIKEIINSWIGWTINLGNPSDRVLFEPFLRFFTLFGLFIFLNVGINESIPSVGFLGALASFVMLHVIFVMPEDKKSNIFSTIMGIYYINIIVHMLTLVDIISIASSNMLVFDFILTLLSTFFVAGGMHTYFYKKIKINKKYWKIDHSSIFILILGLIVSQHVFTLHSVPKTSIVYFFRLQHYYLTFFSLVILLIVFVLYKTSKSFRSYFNKRPDIKDILKEFLKSAAVDLINKFIK